MSGMEDLIEPPLPTVVVEEPSAESTIGPLPEDEEEEDTKST
jgi:hypothetical protein